MNITSSAFAPGEAIPVKYSCQGEGISPPLNIGGVPAGTETLALLVEDPDAPVAGGFLHWLMWNILPATTHIQEGVPPPGAVLGKNDGGAVAYVSLCPPSGEHRYFFRLFALDIALPLTSGTTKDDFLVAADGHVLATAELMGRYRKQ